MDLGMAATSARAGGLWLTTVDRTAANLVLKRGANRSGRGEIPERAIPLDPPGERMPILDAIRTATPI